MSGSAVVVPRQVGDALRRSLRDLCFAGGGGVAVAPAVGVEIEVIPVHAGTSSRVPLMGTGVSTLQIVRTLASRRGWRERRSAKGTPYFSLPEGTLSFEPGGQVELSADPSSSLGELSARVDLVLRELESAAGAHGVQLLGTGIDPVTAVDAVPLQLDAERYVRMAEYFETVSSYGVRMMRQTASVQVSLDAGPEPVARWRLLNALAPFVIAMFANSPRYAGAMTAHQSYRAHCWRMLDPARTGIRAAGADDDMVNGYLDFALAAPDMMRRAPEGIYLPFGTWAARGEWSQEQWETHLSTLFPEVRPRGHFEVRSADALPREWALVPAAFLCGIAYDEAASSDALALAEGSAELLLEAGRRGLQHSRIRSVARDLAELSLAGATRLGERCVDGATLERSRAFFQAYTFRGRSPADDVRDAMAAPAAPPPAVVPASTADAAPG